MAAGILSPAPHANAATITAGSSSNALSAVISVNGKSGSLPNQEVASGRAPPKYTSTKTVASYSKTASLCGLTVPAKGTNISDTASSAGIDSKGGLTAISGASIDSVSATLSSPFGTALTLSATKLVSGASFATTKAGVGTAKGSTSIGSLTINSALFGIKNLKFPLPSKPTVHTPSINQILYHNSDNSVILYLNRQTTNSTAGKVSSIAVSAMTLYVKNFKYSGFTISGDINVATSNAN
jgi:hypothetical protein